MNPARFNTLLPAIERQPFAFDEKKQPTSVVTGAAGFLGSHLTDLLLARGHKVIGIDNFVTGTVDNISHLGGNPNFKFIQQDVTEFIFLNGPVDYVWHFASPASPIDYLELPIQTLKVGSLGTHKALGLAKEKGARFLLASTSEIYGDPLVHPQTEEYWGNVNTIGPRGCYDEAKRFAEAHDDGLSPRAQGRDAHRAHLQHLRPAHAAATTAASCPRSSARRSKTSPSPSSARAQQTRSFCYVSDLIEGIYRLMMSDYDLPVNIGNPAEMTMLRIRRGNHPRHRFAQQNCLQAAAAGRPQTAPARHHQGEKNPSLGAQRCSWTRA